MGLSILPSGLGRRSQALMRVALSHYVTNGMSAAFGMLLISGTVNLFCGAFAAAAAAVGVVVVIPPDQPAPRRGKFLHLLPAAVIGPPLFFAVQRLHGEPFLLGFVLIPATFLAFLGAAWGNRGLPISMSVMFAMIFSMAVPGQADTMTAFINSLYFLVGSSLYLVYGTVANLLLNRRYRAQILADTLLLLAALMRTQAQQFTRRPPDDAAPTPTIGLFLRQLAALADQFQTARNILLETPDSAYRQRLAGMLVQAIELRDHLLACELDLDRMIDQPVHAPALQCSRDILERLAEQIESLADSLLLGRRPPSFTSHREQLAQLQWPEDASAAPAASPFALTRGLAVRVGHIHDEIGRLLALARGEAEPDLAAVRTAWQMFVSPTTWSWLPFTEMFRRDAPSLRHAIRATLAISVAYPIAHALPWGTHDYWVLLTITVVLRGSFAQTVERRNNRVLGTIAGCLLADALLFAHAPHLVLLLTVTLAQGIAHGFATRRYLVTAVAATVLGLVQAHMLSVDSNPIFALIERLADTVLGVAIAWAFSYVLPSWERTLIPSLIRRSLASQAYHARIALGLGQLQAVDNEPEIQWRLARREVYDSLSALVRATQQSLAEPRAVRPPLAPLGRMLAHSYQLLAQLQAVKTMLLLRRGRLDLAQIRPPLAQAAEVIEATLAGRASPSTDGTPDPPPDLQDLPDPFDHDLGPWVLRRLNLAQCIARRLREDAELAQAEQTR